MVRTAIVFSSITLEFARSIGMSRTPECGRKTTKKSLNLMRCICETCWIPCFCLSLLKTQATFLPNWYLPPCFGQDITSRSRSHVTPGISLGRSRARRRSTFEIVPSSILPSRAIDRSPTHTPSSLTQIHVHAVHTHKPVNLPNWYLSAHDSQSERFSNYQVIKSLSHQATNLEWELINLFISLLHNTTQHERSRHKK